jgi:hypothetical protein
MVYLIQGRDLQKQKFTLQRFRQLYLQHGLGSMQNIIASRMN